MPKDLEQNAKSKESSIDRKGESKDNEPPFPPELPCWKRVVLCFIYVGGLFASLYLVNQFCCYLVQFSPIYFCLLKFSPSICGTYIAFAFLIIVLPIDRFIRRRLIVHNARLEDRSEVEATIVEAETVEPRLLNPVRPEDYDKKKKDLDKEVERLRKLGPKGWTEYQVLSLNQMLVDFLGEDDLIARSQLSLADLKEYAEGDAYRYDIEQYYEWSTRINEAIEEIKKSEETAGEKRDDATEPLRANLRTLLEHVSAYGLNWAEGSALLRSLMICGVTAIPIFLAMGILPFTGKLDLFNWAFLGISGSLTAVLLEIRKSNLVEVGNTDGKKELWRAVLGSVLGLVAGILSYAMISGGIFNGAVFPNLDSDSMKDIGLSIVCAFGAGLSFEYIFGRMRGITGDNNQ